MTLKRFPRVNILVMVAGLFAGSGCHSLNLTRAPQIAPKTPEASPADPVSEIICIWESAEGTWEGLPCRGCRGQLLFFTSRQQTPVRASGDILIYVFDDRGTVEEQQKPIHEFRFDSGSFQKFFTETNLGGAYQLFIPYTRPGLERATCTLRVRLTPAEGPPVYSKLASVSLPGTTPEPVVDVVASGRAPTTSKIQRAGYEITVPETLDTSARTPSETPIDAQMAELLNSMSSESPRSDRERLKSRMIQISQFHEPAEAAAPSRLKLNGRQPIVETSLGTESTPAPTSELDHSSHPLLQSAAGN